MIQNSDTSELEHEMRELEGNTNSVQTKLADCQIMLEKSRAGHESVTQEHEELQNENAQLAARAEELRLMFSSEKLAFHRFQERCRPQESTWSTKENLRNLQQESMHLQACIAELQQENDFLRKDTHASEWMLLLRKCRELRQARADLEHKLLERNLRVSEMPGGMMYARPKCLHENRKLRRRNADLRARLAHHIRMEEVAKSGVNWTGLTTLDSRADSKAARDRGESQRSSIASSVPPASDDESFFNETRPAQRNGGHAEPSSKRFGDELGDELSSKRSPSEKARTAQQQGPGSFSGNASQKPPSEGSMVIDKRPKTKKPTPIMTTDSVTKNSSSDASPGASRISDSSGPSD